MSERRRMLIAVIAIVLGASVLLPPGAASATSTTTWVAVLGGAGTDLARDVGVDSAGNSYVVGTFEQTAMFGATSVTTHGGSDVFVAKFQANGTFLWVRQIGSPLDDRAAGIVVRPSGRVYVAGTAWGSNVIGTIGSGGVALPSAGGSDAFVAAFESNGDLFWGATQGGPGNDDAAGIASDDWGRPAITGSFTQSATFGGSVVNSNGTTEAGTNPVTVTAKALQDAYAASFESTGQLRWATDVASGGSQDLGTAIVATGGRVIVAGTFQGATTIGTTQVYAADLNAGAAYVVALSNTFGGAVSWIRLLRGGAGTSAAPFDLATARSGDLLLVGAVRGAVDYLQPGQPKEATMNNGTTSDRSSFVLRLGTGGAYRWSAIGTSTSADAVATGVAVDQGGDVYVVGSFTGQTTWRSAPETAPASVVVGPASGRDGFVARYSPWGNIRNVDAVTGADDQVSDAIAADTSGGARIAGHASGASTFPAGPTITTATTNGYVARLTP